MLEYLACCLIGVLVFLSLVLYLTFYKKVYMLDDNITYKIQEYRPNKHKALKLLYDLNHKSMDLLKHIKTKYNNRIMMGTDSSIPLAELPVQMLGDAKGMLDSMVHQRKSTEVKSETDSCSESIGLILRNYNPDLLSENDPIFTVGDKAFTFNFKRISICLRKRDWSFYDFNTLLFVFLHEIAHTGTHPKYLTVNGKRDNHPPMFWRVFKFLLREAVSIGIITPIDYNEDNYVVYCGIPIKSNPLFDSSIKDLM